jgi:ADP-ribosylglycohydrolase
MSTIADSYEQKVYAGWLGKCIGVRFGAPLENWTYQQIQDHLGEVTDYLPMNEGVVFQPDDDTNIPIILLYGVKDYHLQVTPENVGKTLLNYVGDQHGCFWWGGYGVSTEHTAYLNLKSGITPPLSGSIALNGKTIAEQIGGQIFSDLWGWLNPDQPEKAAEHARMASSVTHDGNAVYGGMFVAALVSAAFNEGDPQRLVEIGLGVIPGDSEYARVVRAVLDFYSHKPDDWRACCEYLHQVFGYDRYPGVVHVIPNAGIVVMGLLYGKGDFSRSIQVTNMGGWDTDCNVGNVGAIMGTAVGLKGIEARWREPVNDVLIAASVIGTRNILDLPGIATLTANLGRQIAGQPAAPRQARCHFDLPGSTHGFRYWGEQRNVLALRQVQHEGKGALKVVVRLLKKKQDMRLYVETYYHRKRLNSDYYGAGFSPKIYPGQALRACLYLPQTSLESILAAPYVRDSMADCIYQGESLKLTPGEWNQLEWQIPPLDSACLTEAGITFRNLGADTWKGEFLIGELDWDGRPHYSLDFSKAMPEYGAINQWTFLRGYWRLEESGYHGSGPETSETYTGDIEWKDVGAKARLVPLLGDYHLVQVRVQGALRSYAAGLAPGGRVALYKKEDGKYWEVKSTPLNWTPGQTYEIELRAEGQRLAVAVNGEQRFEWVDGQSPYLNGQIGLANFPGCHTRYETIHVF